MDSSEKPAPLAIGTRINGYEITSVLEPGGFGLVYAATRLRDGADVVIKENVPGSNARRSPGSIAFTWVEEDAENGTSRAWAHENFLSEIEQMDRLHHPNVVPVTDAFSSPATGTDYYVMPYISPMSLSKARRTVTIDKTWACTLLGQLLAALSYLHGQNTLHRDIKPSNILLSPEGRAILIDFGAARSQMTDGHTRFVSRSYTAPEQVLGQHETPATDIYSLGAVMHRLLNTVHAPLTGGLKGDTRVPLMQQSDVVAQFGEVLAAGVDRAMSQSPGDRFASAEEWLADLRRDADFVAAEGALLVLPALAMPAAPHKAETALIAGAAGGAAVPPVPAAVSPAGGKSHLWITILAILLALLIAVLAAVLLWLHLRNTPPVDLPEPKPAEQTEAPQPVEDPGEQVPTDVQKDAGLLRLIARPGAKFYTAGAPHSELPGTEHAAPVPFVVYYGMPADDEGFCPVMKHRGDAKPFAALKKSEVYEWPLNLLVNYKNPQRDKGDGRFIAKARRRPALYFDTEARVKHFVTELTPEGRDHLTQTAQSALRAKVDSANPDDSAALKLNREFGVLAIEPSRWDADLIERNLPVLKYDHDRPADKNAEQDGADAEDGDALFGYEYGSKLEESEKTARSEEVSTTSTKLLQVAAMVQPADTHDTDAATKPAPGGSSVSKSGSATEKPAAEPLKVDVVFLVDTTKSMTEYMDYMKTFMVNQAKRIMEGCENREANKIADVQLGVVAYRDWKLVQHTASGEREIVPVCDYITRVYDLTGDIGQFSEYVESIKSESKSADDDYYEDMPYGLSVALNYGGKNISWRTMKNGTPSLRFIIQMGDAPYRDDSIKKVGKVEGSSRMAEGSLWAGHDGPVTTDEIRDYLYGRDHAVAFWSWNIINPELMTKLENRGLSGEAYFRDMGYQAQSLSYGDPIFLPTDSISSNDDEAKKSLDSLIDIISDKSTMLAAISDKDVGTFVSDAGTEFGASVVDRDRLQGMDDSELSPMQKIFRAAYVNWLAGDKPEAEDVAAMAGANRTPADEQPLDMVGWTFGTDDDGLSIDTMVALTRPQIQQLVESIRAYIEARKTTEKDDPARLRECEDSLVSNVVSLQSDPNISLSAQEGELRNNLLATIDKLPYRSQLLVKFMNSGEGNHVEFDQSALERLRSLADSLERLYLEAAESADKADDKPIFVPIVKLP